MNLQPRHVLLTGKSNPDPGFLAFFIHLPTSPGREQVQPQRRKLETRLWPKARRLTLHLHAHGSCPGTLSRGPAIPPASSPGPAPIELLSPLAPSPGTEGGPSFTKSNSETVKQSVRAHEGLKTTLYGVNQEAGHSPIALYSWTTSPSARAARARPAQLSPRGEPDGFHLLRSRTKLSPEAREPSGHAGRPSPCSKPSLQGTAVQS